MVAKISNRASVSFWFLMTMWWCMIATKPTKISVAAFQQQEPTSSRRSFFANLVSTAIVSNVCPGPVNALTDRQQLLDAISRKASDKDIIEIIGGLKDPSNGRAAVLPDRLEGEWELMWSYGAEAFSPLLTLPRPFRPNSYQYFGSAAAKEVGDGRIAQGLTGGLLGTNQLWLSSGAIPFDADPSVLEIQPPFRFEIGGRYGTGRLKRTIVESGSDADFRKVNARSEEAQQAGKNQYQQLYLEDSGPGSLRVSTVIAGDPVLVGEIFVHRKL